MIPALPAPSILDTRAPALLLIPAVGRSVVRVAVRRVVREVV